MFWETRIGDIFRKGVPLNDEMQTGDRAELHKAGCRFTVVADNVDEVPFSGKVKGIVDVNDRISLEECGIKKGQSVTFNEQHIQALSRF